MPRIQTLARTMRSLTSRKNSKTNKSKRSAAPVLIAGVALMAAIAFSVSVESRRAAGLRKLSTGSAAEVAKNTSKPAAAVNPSKSTGTSPTFVAPFAPTITATGVMVEQTTARSSPFFKRSSTSSRTLRSSDA